MGILIFIVFVFIDPLGYLIARKCGMPEAMGWKKIIPFCWVFAIKIKN
jgi:hypothetical protein